MENLHPELYKNGTNWQGSMFRRNPRRGLPLRPRDWLGEQLFLTRSASCSPLGLLRISRISVTLGSSGPLETGARVSGSQYCFFVANRPRSFSPLTDTKVNCSSSGLAATAEGSARNSATSRPFAGAKNQDWPSHSTWPLLTSASHAARHQRRGSRAGRCRSVDERGDLRNGTAAGAVGHDGRTSKRGERQVSAHGRSQPVTTRKGHAAAHCTRPGECESPVASAAATSWQAGGVRTHDTGIKSPLLYH